MVRRSVALLAALTISLGAQGTRRQRIPFDYYVLVLSYAPNLCANADRANGSAECRAGRNLGFVLHGLWPQAEGLNSVGPCGAAESPATSIIQRMLPYFLTPQTVLNQWAMHGICSNLSAADYFALVRKARDSLRIPPEFAHPAEPATTTISDVEARFAAVNPVLPKDAIRASCYSDGKLKEIRICFRKDLAGTECVSNGCPFGLVTLEPVR